MRNVDIKQYAIRKLEDRDKIKEEYLKILR